MNGPFTRGVLMNSWRAGVLALAIVWCIGASEEQALGAEEHFLGPTGITGQTSEQHITVSSIAKGSPADGKIKPGDDIAGANGMPFVLDARREMAEAIEQAESHEAKGVLRLTIVGERVVAGGAAAGAPIQSREVTLQLAELGR